MDLFNLDDEEDFEEIEEDEDDIDIDIDIDIDSIDDFSSLINFNKQNIVVDMFDDDEDIDEDEDEDLSEVDFNQKEKKKSFALILKETSTTLATISNEKVSKELAIYSLTDKRNREQKSNIASFLDENYSRTVGLININHKMTIINNQNASDTPSIESAVKRLIINYEQQSANIKEPLSRYVNDLIDMRIPILQNRPTIRENFIEAVEDLYNIYSVFISKKRNDKTQITLNNLSKSSITYPALIKNKSYICSEGNEFITESYFGTVTKSNLNIEMNNDIVTCTKEDCLLKGTQCTGLLGLPDVIYNPIKESILDVVSSDLLSNRYKLIEYRLPLTRLEGIINDLDLQMYFDLYDISRSEEEIKEEERLDLLDKKSKTSYAQLFNELKLSVDSYSDYYINRLKLEEILLNNDIGMDKNLLMTFNSVKPKYNVATMLANFTKTLTSFIDSKTFLTIRRDSYIEEKCKNVTRDLDNYLKVSLEKSREILMDNIPLFASIKIDSIQENIVTEDIQLGEGMTNIINTLFIYRFFADHAEELLVNGCERLHIYNTSGDVNKISSLMKACSRTPINLDSNYELNFLEDKEDYEFIGLPSSIFRNLKDKSSGDYKLFEKLVSDYTPQFRYSSLFDRNILEIILIMSINISDLRGKENYDNSINLLNRNNEEEITDHDIINYILVNITEKPQDISYFLNNDISDFTNLSDEEKIKVIEDCGIEINNSKELKSILEEGGIEADLSKY